MDAKVCQGLVFGQVYRLINSKGYISEAPYNAIHVGAAAPTMPQSLIDQLASPGRLFIPVEDGEFDGGQSIWQVDKDAEGNVTRTRLFGVSVSDPLPQKLSSSFDAQYVPLTDAEKQWLSPR